MAFSSNGGNLVAGDTNGSYDVFIRDTNLNTTERVSVSTAGVGGNSDSYMPSMSDDSRYVTFTSNATNLVAGDTNARSDIFLHDLQSNTTTRISLASDGITEGNNSSSHSSISGDGRYITFESTASNLVAGDTNLRNDVFLHDNQTGVTTRISVPTGGAEGNNNSGSYPVISRDGKFVAFGSSATNLVVGDLNGRSDIFVRDLENNITTRVSVHSSGAESDHVSPVYYLSISEDGRYVAFDSAATNLVDDDTNFTDDVFRHDRTTGETVRVSLSTNLDEGDQRSFGPSISSDGRYIAYWSAATTLVDNDINIEEDIFLTDMNTGETTRVSESVTGVEADGSSGIPTISGDGGFVSFWSLATNLIDGEVGNGAGNYFLVQIVDAGVPVVAPTVSSSPATDIERTSATLNGEITATGGENANERGFEYGITAGYGSESSTLGDYGVEAFSANISSLDCDTLYHFRAFAVNSAGTSNGADTTFETSQCPRSSSGSVSGSIRREHPIPLPILDDLILKIIPSPPVVALDHETIPAFVFKPKIQNTPTIPPTPGIEKPVSNNEVTKVIEEHIPPDEADEPMIVNKETSIGFVESAIISIREFLSNSKVKKITMVAIVAPLLISIIALIGSLWAGIPALNYLRYLFISLFQLLGIKKETKPWGTVYDSSTKNHFRSLESKL